MKKIISIIICFTSVFVYANKIDIEKEIQACNFVTQYFYIMKRIGANEDAGE